MSPPEPFLCATGVKFTFKDETTQCYQIKDNERRFAIYMLYKAGEKPPDSARLKILSIDSDENAVNEVVLESSEKLTTPEGHSTQRWHANGFDVPDNVRLALVETNSNYRIPVTIFRFQEGAVFIPIDVGVGLLLPVDGGNPVLPDLPSDYDLDSPYGKIVGGYEFDSSSMSPLLHDEDYTLGFYALGQLKFTVRNFGSAKITIKAAKIAAQNHTLEFESDSFFSLEPGEKKTLSIIDLYENCKVFDNLQMSSISWNLRCAPKNESTEFSKYSETVVELLKEKDGFPQCTLSFKKRIGHVELVFVVDMSGSMAGHERIEAVRDLWGLLVARLKSQGLKVDHVSASHVSLVVIWDGKVWCRYPVKTENHTLERYDGQFGGAVLNENACADDARSIFDLDTGLYNSLNNKDTTLKEAVDKIYREALDPTCRGTSPIGDAVMRALGGTMEDSSIKVDEKKSLFLQGAPAAENRRFLLLLTDGGENSSAWRFLGTGAPAANIPPLMQLLKKNGLASGEGEVYNQIYLVPIAFPPGSFTGMWTPLLEALDNPVEWGDPGSWLATNWSEHAVLGLFLSQDV